ncbi:hypothetical protein [uncultured Gimesia sp.]|jgi:hypothetical protein|uniref:hypothetical protein n=1 Tax=uncultured Gimesia sp. TaxID=1678688 RepID=UPI002625A2B9|nr:hypothetical protein [uncultured Gimesia sp.]
MDSEWLTLLLFVVVKFFTRWNARVAIYLREGREMVNQNLCAVLSQLRPKKVNMSNLFDAERTIWGQKCGAHREVKRREYLQITKTEGVL